MDGDALLDEFSVAFLSAFRVETSGTHLISSAVYLDLAP